MRNFIYILLVTLFSCNSNGQESLKATDFKSAIEKDGAQILDVRTADEYKSGHIKYSLQANWMNKVEFNDRTSSLDKSKTVYIYCLSGGRSSSAAAELRMKGYQVVNLEGGMNAWKANGLEVEGANPNAKQTTLEAYNGQVNSNSITLVDFGAEWCPPCRKMEPILQSFVKDNKDKLALIKMDGGLETDLMKSLNVEALPTFILYKDGKEIKRKQGLISREEFDNWLK
ncbi:MAG: thioredoxin domain-containing protein [Chitinophagaceae bacterium]